MEGIVKGFLIRKRDQLILILHADGQASIVGIGLKMNFQIKNVIKN